MLRAGAQACVRSASEEKAYQGCVSVVKGIIKQRKQIFFFVAELTTLTLACCIRRCGLAEQGLFPCSFCKQDGCFSLLGVI